MGTGIMADMALRTHEIPYIWPAVEQQVAGLKEEVPKRRKSVVSSLRDLPLVTIDGEDARDFDDAVYQRKTRRAGWRLWVAIADVSYCMCGANAAGSRARKSRHVGFTSRLGCPNVAGGALQRSVFAKPAG